MTKKFVALYKEKNKWIYYDFEEKTFYRDILRENAKKLQVWRLAFLGVFVLPALDHFVPINADSSIVALSFWIGIPLTTIAAFVVYILWIRHTKRLHTDEPRVEKASLTSDELDMLLIKVHKSIREKAFIFALIFGVFIGLVVMSIVSPGFISIILGPFMWGGTIYVILEDKPLRLARFLYLHKKGRITR